MKIGALLSPFVCAAFLTGVGCIERAPTPAAKRAEFDRGPVQSLLVSEVPSTAISQGAIFDHAIELVAFDYFPRMPRPGDTVDVTFFWRVLRPPEVNYKIFVHGEAHGATGRLNADHWPAEGRYPTGVWQAGEIIRDRFPVRVSRHFEGDALSLWTGFYRARKSEERLRLTSVGAGKGDGKNRLRVVSIPIGR